MNAPVTVTDDGVAVEEWRRPLADRPAVPASSLPLSPRPCSILVLAAHPDDETVGAGAWVAARCDLGDNVTVVALTDGEAAFDGVGTTVPQLADVRRRELHNAVGILGAAVLPGPGLPDGGLSADPDRLDRTVAEAVAAVRPQLVVSPWADDPHPDHAALTRSVARVWPGRRLEYPVWMTSRLRPDDPAVPWPRLTVVDAGAAACHRRIRALTRYRSQLTAPAPGVGPVLPPTVVEHFTRLPDLLVRPA